MQYVNSRTIELSEVRATTLTAVRDPWKALENGALYLLVCAVWGIVIVAAFSSLQ
jgi:hypothetical protein